MVPYSDDHVRAASAGSGPSASSSAATAGPASAAAQGHAGVAGVLRSEKPTAATTPAPKAIDLMCGMNAPMSVAL